MASATLTIPPPSEEPALSHADFNALKSEVVRAAGGMSREQLLDMADSLHSILRLRRPGRPVRDAAGWREPETRSFL